MRNIEKEIIKDYIPLMVIGVLIYFVHAGMVVGGTDVVYRTLFLLVAIIQWIGIVVITVQETRSKVRRG